jgi:hypothetical protein
MNNIWKKKDHYYLTPEVPHIEVIENEFVVVSIKNLTNYNRVEKAIIPKYYFKTLIDAKKSIEKAYNLQETFIAPFRVGKKLNRVVLDFTGLEVVKFPQGLENMAQFLVNKLNE